MYKRQAESLDTIGAAVTEALRNQYEQQQAEEEKRIDESIQSWKTWEEETCAAIQGQICLLYTSSSRTVGGSPSGTRLFR